jgi:nitrate reductase NapD
MRKTMSRRHFLAGQFESSEHSDSNAIAIASAVVSIVPGKQDDVISALATLPNTEVGVSESSKIVVILEGRTRSEIGERLAQIAMMEGVITANIVFEHADGEETS